MPTYLIYKATNKLNDKSYIGFTSRPIEFRKREHFYSSRYGDGRFSRAIRKYGIDAFEWSILFESNDLEITKNIMEPKFISEYNTLSNGYNMTTGGDGVVGYEFTDEVRNKLSVFHKTRIRHPHSEEAKRNISVSRSGIEAWNHGLKGENYPFRNPRYSCIKCRKDLPNNVFNRHYC